MSEPQWEFDERRQKIVEEILQFGEELVWYEIDARFSKTEQVKKTLRNRGDSITFLVQDKNEKVLTVGTYFMKEKKVLYEKKQ